MGDEDPCLGGRGMHDEADEKPERVGDDMALAALDLLAGVEAATPLSVVLTFWLSTTPAVGLASRPSSS